MSLVFNYILHVPMDWPGGRQAEEFFEALTDEMRKGGLLHEVHRVVPLRDAHGAYAGSKVLEADLAILALNHVGPAQAKAAVEATARRLGWQHEDRFQLFMKHQDEPYFVDLFDPEVWKRWNPEGPEEDG